MKYLLKWFKNPEYSFPTVLIAGTKGKGSTAHFLNQIISQNSYKTGLYTSPHLTDPRERIRINGRAISKSDFASVVAKIKKIVEQKRKSIVSYGPITFFEIFTLVAILYFAKSKIELGIFEVGMGGRLDATNMLKPLISIITSISYDHQEHLGNTLTAIAGEKAAIIKRHSYVISAKQPKEALHVIQREVKRKQAKAYFYGKEFKTAYEKIGSKGSFFDFQVNGRTLDRFKISMAGEHQIQNAAVALEAVAVLENRYGFPFKGVRIKKALKDAFWPGRFEQVNKWGKEWVLDGAHNDASMEVLARTVRSIYRGRPITLIIGTSREKKVEDLLKPLLALNPYFIFTKSQNPRAMEPKLILEAAGKLGLKHAHSATFDLKSAMELARKISSDNAILLITGSLFLVGEARENLKCPKLI